MTEPEEDLFSGDLVRIGGNTLSDSAGEFTTLSTLYEINKQILLYRNHPYIKVVRPDKETEKLYWDEVESVWKTLLAKITHFSNALKDREKTGSSIRRDIRKVYLLGKPIGQRVLAGAFLELTERGHCKAPEACRRLNDVDWRIDRPMWENVLTRDKTRVLSGVSAMNLGKDFVTYLTGKPLSQSQLAELRERVSPGDGKYKLPKRVASVVKGWGE